MGSTSWSSGIVRTYYSTEESCKLAYEGYHYYKHWQEHIATNDERGYASLRECGCVILRNQGSAAFLDNVVPVQRALGIPVEEWGASKLKQELGWDLTCYGPPKRIDDPGFGQPTKFPEAMHTTGLFFPKTGYVSDPMLATQNLQKAAEAAGAQFKYNAQVVDVVVDSDAGRVTGVALADGTMLHAPVVVNAAGPHSSLITEMVFPGGVDNDMKRSTRALRQEVAYVTAPAGTSYAEADVEGEARGVISADFDTGVYWRPEVGGKILIGGMEPDCDLEHMEYDDPDNEQNPSLSEQWQQQVYRAALRMPWIEIPGASASQGTVACYDVTEDWTPIYDRSCVDGYYMAIGTSGNQFKNAGPAGAMMAALIEACEGGYDHDSEPLVFELERSGKGHAVGMHNWSRLRDPYAISNVVG